MKFQLRAMGTTKWIRITDWNGDQKPQDGKLSIVNNKVGAYKGFESVMSDIGDRGHVRVEIARNVKDKNNKDVPSVWGIHTNDLRPEEEGRYNIPDTHLPPS